MTGHARNPFLVLLIILLIPTAASGAWTALHGATVEGNTDVVARLLTHGMDIEARDEHGRTALLLAVHDFPNHGNPAMVTRLLTAGANPESRNPLDGGTALHLAAKAGRADVVTLLLKHGANPEALETEDWTPLHWAAQEGYPDVVTRLLTHGANPAARTKTGATALVIAKHHHHTRIIRLLTQTPSP